VKQFIGNGDDVVANAVIDDENNIIMAGCFMYQIIFDSITLIGHPPSNDIFIAKLDSNANVIWAKSAWSRSEDEIYNLIIDNNQDILTTGAFSDTINFDQSTLISQGNYDVFLLKYSSAGNLIWKAREGGSYYEFSEGLAVDLNNNVYISGSFDTTIFNHVNYVTNGESDIFIAKFDINGSFKWFKQAGGPDLDESKAIAINDFNELFITGWMSDTVSFDSNTVISAGARDFFIGRITDNTGTGLFTIQSAEFINIFPNPATEYLTIEAFQKSEIEILNIEGQIIKKIAATESLTTIDISDFAKGMYFIKAKMDAGIKVQKFIKN
jgi:hypothetical protein